MLNKRTQLSTGFGSGRGLYHLVKPGHILTKRNQDKLARLQPRCLAALAAMFQGQGSLRSGSTSNIKFVFWEINSPRSEDLCLVISDFI